MKNIKNSGLDCKKREKEGYYVQLEVIRKDARASGAHFHDIFLPAPALHVS